MVLKSYAKINLSLSIINKLASGLHDIQSFYCLINLFDTIYIKKRSERKKTDKIIFKGPFSKYLKRSNNSVKKVLKILRENKYISNYYSISVYKRIPVFAGLGGGTSNAISILKYLISKKINNNLMNKIDRTIGTDSRLFFYDQGYLKNIKTVVKFQKKFKLFFIIANPRIISSTKEVYSKVKVFSNENVQIKKNFSSKKNFIEHLRKSKNDLQFIVEKKHPKVKSLLLSINDLKGCYFSRMSGSGSSCYGLFSNQNCLKVALKSLRKKYPKFQFSIAKTI